MAVQLFIQNPDSGEPYALCGSLEDDPTTLATAIGRYVEAEARSVAEFGEKEFTMVVKMQEMTEAEVAALPDL